MTRTPTANPVETRACAVEAAWDANARGELDEDLVDDAVARWLDARRAAHADHPVTDPPLPYTGTPSDQLAQAWFDFEVSAPILTRTDPHFRAVTRAMDAWIAAQHLDHLVQLSGVVPCELRAQTLAVLRRWEIECIELGDRGSTIQVRQLLFEDLANQLHPPAPEITP